MYVQVTQPASELEEQEQPSALLSSTIKAKENDNNWEDVEQYQPIELD